MRYRFVESKNENHIIASFVSNGLLPYRGIGSGVKRAIELWPKIDFENDETGYEFKAIVKREERRKSTEKKYGENENSRVKSKVKTEDKILKLMKENPEITIQEIVEKIGLTRRAIDKQISKLKETKRLERIGPLKGGSWKVLDKKVR